MEAAAIPTPDGVVIGAVGDDGRGQKATRRPDRLIDNDLGSGSLESSGEGGAELTTRLNHPRGNNSAAQDLMGTPSMSPEEDEEVVVLMQQNNPLLADVDTEENHDTTGNVCIGEVSLVW